MKRMDYTRDARNARPALYRVPGTARAETAMFGTLALVGLATVCVALIWAGAPASPHTSALAGYFRSGQMKADVRTINAMVQYLMETDQPTLTHFIDQSNTQWNLAMPTNMARPKPSV